MHLVYALQTSLPQVTIPSISRWYFVSVAQSHPNPLVLFPDCWTIRLMTRPCSERSLLPDFAPLAPRPHCWHSGLSRCDDVPVHRSRDSVKKHKLRPEGALLYKTRLTPKAGGSKNMERHRLHDVQPFSFWVTCLLR